MRQAPTKRQLKLALLAASMFLAVAAVNVIEALLRRPGVHAATAAGFAGVAVLWFVIYFTWKKRAA